jgi:ATP-binding cassette subfamily F protein uup
VGILGPNGSGKTTLLKLMLNQLESQTGKLKMGTRLHLAYFDQNRTQLDENQTVQWNVCGENSTVTINGERRHVVGYMQEWLFSPDRLRTPVKVLSGGERNRLLLAKLFTQPANLLVLDEPTNDLDIETLDVLEDVLVNFPGTLIVVSHDRDFLNNVVTSTLSPAGDGRWNEFIGGYDDYLRQSSAQRTQSTLAPRAAPKTESAKPKTEKARRLSFKEKQELEALPARIEKLEAEHEALVAKMSDPEFYKGEATQTVAAKNRLDEIADELEIAFAHWEELEALTAG